MKKFDIRKYIWNVFELTIAQDIGNVKTGLELFIQNMELGRYRYKGVTNVDFRALGDKWNLLSEQDRQYQVMVFNTIIDKSMIDLSRLWNDKDRKAFMDICFIDKKVYGIPELQTQKKPNTKHKYKKRKYKKGKKKEL